MRLFVHSVFIQIQRIAYTFALILFFLSFVNEVSSENKERSKLFIIDASGSMNEYLGIYQKIHLAKKHVSHYIAGLPSETDVGFMAYGNRVPGCSSSRLYQPLEAGNHEAFKSRLFGLTPSGTTPLAESIRIAGTLISQRKKETEIILVTDGVESCYGDPKKELQVLKQKGIPFKFHIFGLGLKPNEEQQMRILTEEGNGNYFGIEDDSSFYTALDSLKTQSDTVAAVKEPQKNPIPKPNNDLMVWFEKIHRKPRISDTQVMYIIDFGFKAGNSPKNCVVLNVKRKANSPRQSLGPKRISSPENLIRTESVCFDLSEGKGKIEIQVPAEDSLTGVLELWDMTGVPSALGVSEEEELR
ncbi:vWA domain-containing protein [Leptospira barantonii]|uniref:VWFA domain-containing protein n=1 Tax=Leptospira barantonii TaxID=2023184 RepID=A0ABX4NHF4_9LEPT|nr:vWA domain-containing protein [Leptospira barantonii]PJZ56220.1 hypothetical protein CH367_15280 [Leptospira barantonii]